MEKQTAITRLLSPWVELEVRGQLHHQLPGAVQELQKDGAALVLLGGRDSPGQAVSMPKMEWVSKRQPVLLDEHLNAPVHQYTTLTRTMKRLRRWSIHLTAVLDKRQARYAWAEKIPPPCSIYVPTRPVHFTLICIATLNGICMGKGIRSWLCCQLHTEWASVLIRTANNHHDST